MPSIDLHHDKANFRYIEWQDLYKVEKPFQILIDIPKDSPDQRRENLVFKDGEEEVVQNVKTTGEDYTLDKHGFTYVKHISQLKSLDFFQKGRVESVFLPECEALIRRNLNGVDKVYFYNWLVRNSESITKVGRTVDLNDPLTELGPAKVVHIDQSASSAVERTYLHLPSEADQLLQGRVRLINLWRPINGPVETWPLAVCDGRTISPSALLEADRVRRAYTGGTTFVLNEDGRKWYYMHRQNDEDVVIFKNFDSDYRVTPYAAHTSFLPSYVPPNAPPRQSIEVRAMVYTYPESL